MNKLMTAALACVALCAASAEAQAPPVESWMLTGTVSNHVVVSDGSTADGGGNFIGSVMIVRGDRVSIRFPAQVVRGRLVDGELVGMRFGKFARTFSRLNGRTRCTSCSGTIMPGADALHADVVVRAEFESKETPARLGVRVQLGWTLQAERVK
jgi:hypothetical protein